MDFNKAKGKVSKALERFLLENGPLLEVKVHERTITAKLACYLSQQFKDDDWDVDCEYNRNKGEAKVLDGIRECSKEKKTDAIYPDIIVHKRGKTGRENNLLIVEAKNGLKETVCDLRKLELLTKKDGDYSYQFGLYILGFTAIGKPKLKWFRDGKPV